MLESVIETKVCEFAEKQGWLRRKVVYPGRRGAPDSWFFRDGRLVIIEFKRAVDGRMSKLQVRERQRLAEHGFTVHVIDGIADGCALLV